MKANPDAGKFPLKDKDTAMASAFAFLRSKVGINCAHTYHLKRFNWRP